MQRPSPHRHVYRPNSTGFYATIAAFCVLSCVAGNAMFADRGNDVVWLFVVAISSIITPALATVRITVMSSRISLSSLGTSRVFPTALIDARRFHDFSEMGMFQLALQTGHFILIPRAAFADAAPFSAIESVARISAASNSSARWDAQS